MKRIRLSLILSVGLAGACAGDPPPRLTVVGGEVPSPAGVGSGEPFLSSSGDVVYMSWLERAGSRGHELRFSRFNGSAWDEPVVIAASDRFFVNWADFPSVTPGPDGTLWVHWLERSGRGYDYGVRVTHSADGGATWAEPWTPHEDGTPTEHGFVSVMFMDDEVGLLWLDGRDFAPGPDGSPPSREMSLRFRTASAHGLPGPETVVDSRVCDCCQTDAAMTSSGPIAVYRDRTLEEIRDIYVTRWNDGSWTEGMVVHDDGWETGACPVNGPAVVAHGQDVAVAWFTAAGGVPHVKVSFSDDAGGRFADPIVVDGGSPAGRVDLLMLESGAVLVSWLERTGGEGAEVRLRTVRPSGAVSESVSAGAASAERAGGFPRIVETPDGAVLLAWTDVTDLEPRVRLTLIEMEGS